MTGDILAGLSGADVNDQVLASIPPTAKAMAWMHAGVDSFDPAGIHHPLGFDGADQAAPGVSTKAQLDAHAGDISSIQSDLTAAESNITTLQALSHLDSEGNIAWSTTNLSSGTATSIGSPLSITNSKAFATVIDLELMGVVLNNGAASVRNMVAAWTATGGTITYHDHANPVQAEVNRQVSIVQHARLFLPASTASSVQLTITCNNNLGQVLAGYWRWRRRTALPGETS